MVIDHTSYAVSETEGGDHTLIASDDLIHSEVILGSKKIEVTFSWVLFYLVNWCRRAIAFHRPYPSNINHHKSYFCLLW